MVENDSSILYQVSTAECPKKRITSTSSIVFHQFNHFPGLQTETSSWPLGDPSAAPWTNSDVAHPAAAQSWGPRFRRKRGPGNCSPPCCRSCTPGIHIRSWIHSYIHVFVCSMIYVYIIFTYLYIIYTYTYAYSLSLSLSPSAWNIYICVCVCVHVFLDCVLLNLYSICVYKWIYEYAYYTCVCAGVRLDLCMCIYIYTYNYI